MLDTIESLKSFSSADLIAEVIRRKTEAESALAMLKSEPETIRNITDHCVSVACDFFKKNKSDLLAQVRFADVVKVRQIVMFAAVTQYEVSLAEVGRYFSKDHATVIHSVKAVRDQIEFNEKYAQEVQDYLTALVSGGFAAPTR